jgi:hypothetical protein
MEEQHGEGFVDRVSIAWERLDGTFSNTSVTTIKLPDKIQEAESESNF